MRRKIQQSTSRPWNGRKNGSRRVAKPPRLGIWQIQPDLRLGKGNSSQYLGLRVHRLQLCPQRTPFLNFSRRESRSQACGCRIPLPTIRILPLHRILDKRTVPRLFNRPIQLHNFLHQPPRRKDGRIFHRFFCQSAPGKRHGIGRRFYSNLKLFYETFPSPVKGHLHGTSSSLQGSSPNPPGSWMDRQPLRQPLGDIPSMLSSPQ